MNQRHYHFAFSALVLVSAMVACVLPGQAPQPTPGLNPIIIETAVAGTAQAAAEQTAAAQPTLPGTTGTTLEQLEDGTTRYTDHDAGFEITFPVGWLAVRPNSEEFEAAVAKEGKNNPGLHDQMIADLAAETEASPHRLFAYILRPDILKNVMLGYSKVVWDAEMAQPLDNALMGQLVREMEAPGGIPGFRADTAQLHEEGAVRIMEIGGRWTLSDAEGTLPMYATLLFFQPTPTSGVRITFSFVDEYRAQISADVKFIRESVTMIGQ
jgi:hypothetical protein